MRILVLQCHSAKLHRSFGALERVIMFTREAFVFEATANAVGKMVFKTLVCIIGIALKFHPFHKVQECISAHS